MLYSALLTHLGLAIWALYQRRHWRMPVAEMLQLLFGLTIPLLLTIHIVGTRLNHEFFGVDDSYTLMVLTLWHAAPMDGLKQAILIVIAWTHGCIGCHYWLRLKKWYPRIAPYLLASGVAYPSVRAVGFRRCRSGSVQPDRAPAGMARAFPRGCESAAAQPASGVVPDL